jgi:AAA15 family ATPase/GTPase
MPMKLNNIVNNLKIEANKSTISHKHACVALVGHKVISPYFHNYMRYQVFGFICGSCHAEMATINYLLNTICKGPRGKKQTCILQAFQFNGID